VFDSKSVDDSNCADVDRCVLTKAVLKGDTIEELAGQLGADPDVLKASIDRYNELVALGEDLDFGKDSAHMTTPVDTPPYYVCESPPDLLCAMGGVLRNADCEVLDDEYKPIPGLYVAGNIASSFWGDTYPMGFLGGIARSHALVFGQLAGIRVAES
jgi:fumarate reductase flavoprotein subunit